MNIVILGAGDTGKYITSVLAKEQHNIVLIDKQVKKLEEAAWNIDVATREGFGTDWKLLDSLLDFSPDLFIALTGEDQTNLVSCSIAKNLGYPRTIARVRDNRYLNRTRLDFSRIFDVDYFICPELLVANEIYKYMNSPGSLRVESFAHGAVQLRTILIPQNWERMNETLSHLHLPKGMMIALIRRWENGDKDKELIFPHGGDHIFPGDEVTLIGETDVISEAHHYFNLSQRPVRSVVIIGGSRTAVNLSKILEKRGMKVRVIEKDYHKCCEIAERLHHTTVINHDGTDLEFLMAEKVGQADVTVVSTQSDEANVMIGLLAKEAGCENVIIQLTNTAYIPIANRLGINHTPSPGVVAANRILALALSGTVTSVISLHKNQAEIMEISVSPTSKMTGIPIAELGSMLPKDFLIAAIQNRGRIMIANGDRIISPGDSVIVVSHPKHLRELESIF